MNDRQAGRSPGMRMRCGRGAGATDGYADSTRGRSSRRSDGADPPNLMARCLVGPNRLTARLSSATAPACSNSLLARAIPGSADTSPHSRDGEMCGGAGERGVQEADTAIPQNSTALRAASHRLCPAHRRCTPAAAGDHLPDQRQQNALETCARSMWRRRVRSTRGFMKREFSRRPPRRSRTSGQVLHCGQGELTTGLAETYDFRAIAKSALVHEHLRIRLVRPLRPSLNRERLRRAASPGTNLLRGDPGLSASSPTQRLRWTPRACIWVQVEWRP